jgi:hypothetical protein
MTPLQSKARLEQPDQPSAVCCDAGPLENPQETGRAAPSVSAENAQVSRPPCSRMNVAGIRSALPGDFFKFLVNET